jgi:hypothetical protein
LTERPQNVRFATTIERTHNSRRHRVESRSDEAQMPARSYRGSHRADHTEHLHRSGHIQRDVYRHHADDARSAAHDRNSRVGGHHSGRQTDRSNRW